MKLMQEAQQFQKRAKKIQDELAQREYKASAADGKIEVTVNGEGQMIALQLAPSLLQETPDAEMIADMIVMASREAFQKGRDNMQREMSKLTSGLGLPPGLI